MDNVKTGKFIAECRRELGLTQQQLADMLNLSNKTISKWESGAGSPDTVLVNFPLLCPKCKQETLISVKDMKVSAIKNGVE